MVDLSVIRDLVAIFSFIVGLTYYIMTLRNQRKNQNLQGLFTVWNALRDPVFYREAMEIMEWEWTDFDDFMSKYGIGVDAVKRAQWGSVFEYFDMLGYMWKKGVLDLENISDIITGVSVVTFWRRFEPVVLGFREDTVNRFQIVHPVWQWWEELALALIPLVEKKSNNP